MKNLVAGVLLAVATVFSANAQKKEVKTVTLEQTKGEFTQKAITLSEGTYIFEVANENVGHNVGFVLAPKGKTDQAHHIKNAYVTKQVENNTTGHSNEVTLAKGEYVYFCPLNPTPQYTLTVE
ncbi:plastocyanin/azurin family copper-binding protein [Wenyingzhuangia sp. 2_MG-2023]|uniref:plastocyanin/azurin family copper-binding protein n=1 Tax=Wenyingzhuangia sp. 2_MG-2023 TaxID=3062639 RepID=UPI0026E376CB|nr:plastocyanin/azurin family copper-binding protein [Wenyingzhuangia sp. 2_MG-2023]MDO6737606.1 cupredoxin domain-containing protein [Wenyingzhuangia sp. 2_MG-2023]MDO6802444.1 cupredoxin domain-containing protein [Wenyingzhuangia sp. 1_MG-2023]